MKPIVVIPALHPDGKLISLVNELKEQGMHTDVVDDGSGADYAELFQQLKADYHCDLCIHPANRGKGVALKTALAEDTFGRNIKAATSSITDSHQAILAINGDYYGFRATSYGMA
ncbi:nucleotide-diphospho-sugar transferases [Trichococcus palustris]|uniref:Nucleotide-diphospho-sugar transferases n=1 Tax=Trichococcus palustris TaxID=140314 RepID=A0A143Y7P8_9LACT|nr:hypothetical protein [Trichococcus palustris]CZQ82061.1 nucleotide-diphospho-sugar transferases [Trichococcus palustris]SFK61113.1 hypothetical protein SAMN04488076_10216 [Trichococcus palustris]